MNLHSHPCVTCGFRFECDGDFKPNYDGFPEVICDEYHERENNQCMGCALKAAEAENEPETEDDGA